MDLRWFRPEQGLVCAALLGRPLRTAKDEDEAAQEMLSVVLALLRFMASDQGLARERFEAVVPAACYELNVRFGALSGGDSPAFRAITDSQLHVDYIANVALEIEQGVAWPRVRDPTHAWLIGE